MQKLNPKCWRIAYLLESATLCGGVKVVLRQAEALTRRGHTVDVICKDPWPGWFDGALSYLMATPFNPGIADHYDYIVGTTPRLVLYHYNPLQIKRLLHLVQGFEAEIIEARPYLDIIQQAYSLPVVKMTVSSFLNEKISRFYPESHICTIGQGLETHLFFMKKNCRQPVSPPDEVILIGPLTTSFKHIHLGLTAFRLARQRRPELKLIRVSQVDTRDQEAAMSGSAEAYYTHLDPADVGKLLRTINGVLISPSTPAEGFGLPPVEAMACGVPTILSDIPAYRRFANPCNYAKFVPCDDPQAMADAICDLTRDTPERRSYIRRGLEVATTYSFDRVADKLEALFDSLA